jgi:hypothetical protein
VFVYCLIVHYYWQDIRWLFGHGDSGG